MDETAIALRRRRALGWIVGLVLLGGLLILAQVTVGWEALLRPWRSLSPGTVSVALALILFSFLVRTRRIQVYFRPEVGKRFRRTFRLMLVHNLMNNLLPMRTGEASFPILMGREFGVPLVRSVPGLLYLRLLDLHFVLFLGLTVLAFQRHPGLGMAALALGPLPFLLFLARGRLTTDPGQNEGRIRKAISAGLQGLPGSPGLFAGIWLWTAVNWTVKLAAYGWILTTFIPLPMGHAVIGATTGELSSVLPFHGVAGAGTYEAGVMAGLVPLGVDLETALTGAVNLHLFVLGASIVAGAVAMAVPARGGRKVEGPPVEAPAVEAPAVEAPAVEAPVAEASSVEAAIGEKTQESDIFDR